MLVTVTTFHREPSPALGTVLTAAACPFPLPLSLRSSARIFWRDVLKATSSSLPYAHCR